MSARVDLPPTLKRATARLNATRGDLPQLRRVFARSLIPTLMVDNDRRCVEVNAAARLLLRMSSRELRRNRVDDLAGAKNRPAMEAAWAQLLTGRSTARRSYVTFHDGGSLWVSCAGLAHVLPARHLIVFVPADWPGDELERTHPGAAPEIRGHLTPRQLDVLRLVALGASAGEIASELSISRATVRTHVNNILARLGAHSRAQAVALAMTSGMLDDSLAQSS